MSSPSTATPLSLSEPAATIRALSGDTHDPYGATVRSLVAGEVGDVCTSALRPCGAISKHEPSLRIEEDGGDQEQHEGRRAEKQDRLRRAKLGRLSERGTHQIHGVADRVHPRGHAQHDG